MRATLPFEIADSPRIAVISDIHGNLLALQAVLADALRRGYDLMVNLGDIVSGPLWPSETARLLLSMGIPTIKGNHERQLLSSHDTLGASDRFARDMLSPREIGWVTNLPNVLELGREVLLVHGTPGSDLDYLMETVSESGRRAASDQEIAERLDRETASLVLCGHSHLPCSRRLPDGRLVVNPGSVGLQAFTYDRPFRHSISSGSPLASYAIVHREAGEWCAQHHRVSYDFEQAASRAKGRGDSLTAHWLRTGEI